MQLLVKLIAERTVVIESEKVKVKDIYGILLLFITVIIIITTK